MDRQTKKLILCMAAMLTIASVGLVVKATSEKEPETEVQTFIWYKYVEVTVGYNDTVWEIVSEVLDTDDYAEIQSTIDMMNYYDVDNINVGDTVKVPVAYEYQMEVVVE